MCVCVCVCVYARALAVLLFSSALHCLLVACVLYSTGRRQRETEKSASIVGGRETCCKNIARNRDTALGLARVCFELSFQVNAATISCSMVA